MDWYLVRSKPRQEKVADWNLQRLGVNSFCPQLRQTKQIRGKRQTVLDPLFPGYLFARFDFQTEYRKVAYAHGVANVVMFGGVPAKVDEKIIDIIQQRIQEGCRSGSTGSFTFGQPVRIEEGPMKGFVAVFERELTGTQRVALLLKTVSYSARLIVEREWISGIENI